VVANVSFQIDKLSLHDTLSCVTAVFLIEHANYALFRRLTTFVVANCDIKVVGIAAIAAAFNRSYLSQNGY